MPLQLYKHVRTNRRAYIIAIIDHTVRVRYQETGRTYCYDRDRFNRVFVKINT